MADGVRSVRRRLLAALVTTAVAAMAVAASGMVVSGPGAQVEARAGTGASGRMTSAVSTRTTVRPAGGHVAGTGDYLCTTTSPAQCQDPRTMRAAYGFDTLIRQGLTGQGRTIVVVDAFTSPTVAADLKEFDRQFRLPDPVFVQVAPDGVPAYDVSDDDHVGWAGEISLDVEWAHAVAPGARIVLVSARSDEDADIISALRYAVRHNLGDVISQSFYENETCMSGADRAELHRIYTEATAKGISLLASSGDVGAAQFTCDGAGFAKEVALPAAEPLVTGVGGTTLNVDGPSGTYRGETTWAYTGGGLSTVYGAPDFQAQTRLRARAVPDVSFEADGATGPLVVWSSSPYDGGPVFVFEGTSVGSPQWAGLVAVADQIRHGRLGLLNQALYTLARNPATYRLAFRDVTSGDNTFPVDDSTVISGYSAHPGFDLTTGLGSPRADRLAPLLALK